MTEPGAGEGISWIDIAASAAGIEGQMRAIGQKAAGAFSQSFNSRVGPELSRAMSGMSQAGTQHGQAFGQAFSQAAAGSVRGTGQQLSQALGQQLRSAASSSGEASKSGSALGNALGGGITKGFAEIGVGAVIGAKVVQEFTDVKRAVATTIGGFEKLGADTADTLMTGFTDVLAGRMPSVQQAFGLLAESVQVGLESTVVSARAALDATVGMVPVVGAAVDAGLDQIDSALGGTISEVTKFGSVWTQAMIDVGDQWQETARTIAGQTLDTSAMRTDLGILRDLAGSGTVANFRDLAGAVGELGQRLSGLGDGVGLSTSQLEELTKTLGLADELLGLKVNVDNLTAAFNDFNVAPEQTADELTTLTNIARMTGDNLNNLLTNVDQLGPVLQSLGYDLDETAFFAGRMNQELGPVAAGRMGASFVTMDEKLHKAGVTWQGLIDVVKAYHQAGDDVAATDYLKGMGASARNAANFVKLINTGILAMPEQLRAAMDASGDALHTPLEQAVEDTRTLQDTLNDVSNQLKEAFADIGLPLVEGLNHASEHIRNWLQDHKGDMIRWGNDIMQGVLTVVSTVATDVGQLLVALGPILNTFKTATLDFFDGILVAIQGVVKPLSLLPDWLGGDVFKAVDQGLQDSEKGLSKLANIDIGPMLQTAGQGLQTLGQKARDAKGPLDALALTGRDMAALDNAFSGRFAAKPGDPVEFQDTIISDDQGLKLAPGSDWGQTVERLYNLGINVDFDENTGRITRIVANTKDEADALADYLKDKLGPKAWEQLKPKVHVEVQEQPPLSDDETRQKLGLPSEIEIPAIPAPKPPPGAGPPIPPGSDIQLPPGPGSDGHQEPLHTTESGWQTRSNGLVGVVLPTSLTVRDPSERQTMGKLMDAVGIPSSAQGSDGVTLPVGFDVQSMPQLSIPMPDGMGGPTPGWSPQGGGGPTVRYAGRAGGPEAWRSTVRTVLAQYGGRLGIPEDAYGAWEDAIVAQIRTESQGDPNAQNNTDSNAIAGHPTRGLLQFLDSTYAAHNITGRPYPDPIGEIAAALSYAPRTPDGWPATTGPHAIGQGHGFAGGGWVKGPLWAGRDSVPMNLPAGTFVVRRDQALSQRAALDKIMSGAGGHAAGSHRMVRAVVQPDERLIPPKIAAANLGKLWAINSGVKVCADPGCTNPNHLHMGGVAMQGGGVLQVIWDNPRTGDQIGEANSSLVGPGTSQPGYYRNDWKDHTGHVHTSFASGPDGSFYGLPKGTDIRQGGPGFPSWVYQLGEQYGLEASTYPGHQEGSGYNRGIDWWPKGHADMSGQSYSADELARLQAFASALAMTGSAGQGATTGAPWMTQADYHLGEGYPDPAGGGGPGSGLAGVNFTTAGYGGGGGIFAAGHGEGGGVPAPTAPGSNYASVPPPPGMQPAAPGTPDAIHTPFGDFVYSWQMPPDQSAKLSPEQRQRYDEWLRKQERQQEQTSNTQADIDRAQERLTQLQQKRDEADAELRRRDAEINKLPADAQKTARQDPEYQKAAQAAANADRAYAEAQNSLTNLKRRQHDEDTQQHIDAESPPPWVSRGGGDRSDSNAETLGKGLVKGIFQELGFPDVFGKPPIEWGIAKLAMGGLGWGLNLAQQAGGGGYGMPTSGGGGGGILDSVLRGIPGLMPSRAQSGWSPYGRQPGGAPSTPATAPAMAYSGTPANVPAAVTAAANTGPGLTVHAPMSGVMDPGSAGKFVNRILSGSQFGTSAPVLSGGGGIPR
ncbi:hypothetical protein [Mycobacterium paraffinicum]|uniref:Tape measure protein n=1 Tax=Mycobacterium paraffinicum TaxID=53378 RepID=A0ABP8F7C9_9MYCO|nr:hypothetical protein [Mycobacterium paraffinicum]MCV7313733.1 hypothetical protein [Mycobacterium paraffinicum]